MSDLTDRMRTCAARIAAITDPAKNDASINDAVDLLVEASNVIEAIPQPLGEPMEIIPPLPPRTIHELADDLATQRTTDHSGFPSSPNACPQCGSHAAKTVRREGRKLMLVCPVCASSWQWQPKAQWV